MEVKAGSSFTPYYFHADGLGSITGLSDATGTMVQTYGYDAFGNVTVSGSGNIAQPFAFTGREYDTETQMYFYRARYYDPQAGRFVTRDPIGFEGGDFNLYGYVGNNTVNYVDSFGFYTEIIVWQPVTWGSSSFGHISANVNGINYSWAPGGWDSNPSASSYAQNQEKFRSGVGTILRLTPDQEKKLIECYAKKRKDYNTFTNNCGDPHKECLKEATGMTFSDSNFPVNIGNDLLNSIYLDRLKFYQGPSRDYWRDAPWAH